MGASERLPRVAPSSMYIPAVGAGRRAEGRSVGREASGVGDTRDTDTKASGTGRRPGGPGGRGNLVVVPPGFGARGPEDRTGGGA